MVAPMQESAPGLRFCYSVRIRVARLILLKFRRAEVDPFRSKMGLFPPRILTHIRPRSTSMSTAKIRFHPSPSSAVQQRMSQWASGHQQILRQPLAWPGRAYILNSAALLEASPRHSDQVKTS